MKPESFGGGETAPDGSAWELFGERYPRNPRFLVTAESLETLRLWRYARGGMAGPGPLPEAGGLLDQSAWLMAAFDVMSGAAAVLEKKG